MRSRAVSFPIAICFSTALLPPPFNNLLFRWKKSVCLLAVVTEITCQMFRNAKCRSGIARGRMRKHTKVLKKNDKYRKVKKKRRKAGERQSQSLREHRGLQRGFYVVKKSYTNHLCLPSSKMRRGRFHFFCFCCCFLIFPTKISSSVYL